MKEQDFKGIFGLIRNEVRDAKIKAFDKMLQYMISDQTAGELYDGAGDELMKIYTEYKDDIKNIIKLYAPAAPKDTQSSLSDFLKDLKDMHDD